MTEPAKTEEKPISKEEQKILDLEGDLKMARGRNLDLEAAFAELQRENENLEKELKAAEVEAADRRGAYKVQKAEADALKAQLAADPNLAELVKLRQEVSLGQSKYEVLHKDLTRQFFIVSQTNLEKKNLEARVLQFQATLETMQIARDRAAERESAAYGKVAILERDFEQVKKMSAEYSVVARNLGNTLDAVEAAHSKGHPAAVAGCAICSALGREVSPAAAPAETVKS